MARRRRSAKCREWPAVQAQGITHIVQSNGVGELRVKPDDLVEKLPPGHVTESLGEASIDEQRDDLASPTVHMVSVDKLWENPLNHTLYDRVVNPAILESVEQHGVLVPVRAMRNGKLIDGWQRVEAAKSSSYRMVPVIYVKIEEANELETILTYNAQRIKNTVERLREYRAYLEIETAKARDRAGLRTDVGTKLPEGRHEWGKSRDLAAKKVGLSGSSAERGLRVLEEIEKRPGTDPADEALRKLLNDGINARWKYAHSLGWIEAAVKPRPIQSKSQQKENVVSEVRQHSAEETDESSGGRQLRESDHVTMEDGWLADEAIAEVVSVVNTSDVAFDLRGLLLSIRPQLYLVTGTDVGEARGVKLKLLANALSILAEKSACSSTETKPESK
jgi:ParB-like chromosome segregation protein Spo0J